MKSYYKLIWNTYFFVTLLFDFSLSSSIDNIVQFKGGLVPQANEIGGDYYEKFELDYDCNDNLRSAGSTRGLIKSGKLSELSESDPFLKWINDHLEKGQQPLSGRVKSFYAADFGTRKDLSRGENPKIIIVNRKLKATKDGLLAPGNKDIDVEVRNIWQPWLKARCNFAVRYIVPNRINIIKIMESKGRFRNELVIENDPKDNNIKRAWAKLTFKPSRAERLSGKKDIIMKKPLPYDSLV